MSRFVTNPLDFSADCARESGQCLVARENIVFLDDDEESAAVSRVQMQCGNVVIIPDAANAGQALLFHTSCQRMADVVEQIFRDRLQSPESLPHHHSEMSVGELRRRRITLSFDECKQKVAAFDF